MRHTRFGRTEAQVPVVSFGTWAHGGPKEVGGRAVGWSGADDDLARAALRLAHAHGITHWDTADAYGNGRSERIIGSLWDDLPRDDLFLATKVGWDPGNYDGFYDPRLVAEHVDRSLRYLQTDRIDLYYFHHCQFPDDGRLDGCLEVVRRAQTAGKVRWVGLSDWDASAILRYAPRIDPDVVQPYRNLFDDAYSSSGLADWVQAHDLGVAFFSPLKHGLLLGKYDAPPELGEGDHRAAIPGFSDPALLARLRECRRQVEARLAPHPQAVLQAVTGALLEYEGSCVLLGLRNPDQVRAAAQLGDPLSARDRAWIRELYTRARDGG